jgi:hypothetical protein
MKTFQNWLYYKEIKHHTIGILTCCHWNLKYGDIIRQVDLKALYTQCFTVLNAGKDIQFPKVQFNKLDVPGNVDRKLH